MNVAAAVAWEAGKPLVIEEVEVAHCKSEESNMCDLLRINTDRGVIIHDSQTRFSVKGQPIYHFVGTSTFSEYTVVHAGCVAKVNPTAPT